MKIAFLGDSVTEGCFELYLNGENNVDCIRDIEHCYPSLVSDILIEKYPEKDIETKNFGVCGNSSENGLTRIETVMEWNPDIVIVCYGLNDVCNRSKAEYIKNMEFIFNKITVVGAKGIFMTPNMMNTYVADGVLPKYIGMAHNTAEKQNDGSFDDYLFAAMDKAKECGVEVCDAYSYWKDLQKYGIDTTKLLCNLINHPIRKMHILFADMLVDILEKML